MALTWPKRFIAEAPGPRLTVVAHVVPVMLDAVASNPKVPEHRRCDPLPPETWVDFDDQNEPAEGDHQGVWNRLRGCELLVIRRACTRKSGACDCDRCDRERFEAQEREQRESYVRALQAERAQLAPALRARAANRLAGIRKTMPELVPLYDRPRDVENQIAQRLENIDSELDRVT